MHVSEFFDQLNQAIKQGREVNNMLQRADGCRNSKELKSYIQEARKVSNRLDKKLIELDEALNAEVEVKIEPNVDPDPDNWGEGNRA